MHTYIKKYNSKSTRLPFCIQSTPKRWLFSLTCCAFNSVNVLIDGRPEFSAKAIGTLSNASAKDRKAYCSRLQKKQQKGIKLTLAPIQILRSTSSKSYHLISASYKNRHCSIIGALFYAQHFILGRTERNFPNDAGRAQFLSRNFSETRHDTSVGGDGDQFDFRAAYPTYGG
uniref:Uncharacterized protein n=1 Tax=Romanomermis culicivorax TaxID=13658 RepID=A0A915KZM6_ROMCU